jgi:hypothetical protein
MWFLRVPKHIVFQALPSLGCFHVGVRPSQGAYHFADPESPNKDTASAIRGTLLGTVHRYDCVYGNVLVPRCAARCLVSDIGLTRRLC